MKIRIGDQIEVPAPLAGGDMVVNLLEVSMTVPDTASDAEIAAAAARLTRAHRIAAVERYWETRQILLENGVAIESSAGEQQAQAAAEAKRRGGHL